MRKLFFILIVLNCVKATAQFNTDIPKEVRHFVVKGFEAYDYVEGDVNADGRQDAILILQHKQQGKLIVATDEYFDTVRPFILLLRNAENKLCQAVRNDSILIELSSVRNYEATEIDTIKHNGFRLFFSGGIRYVWQRYLTFKFKKDLNEFVWVEEENMSIDARSDDDKNDEQYAIKESELSKITLAKFNYDADYFAVPENGEIIAAKTFFYTNADVASMPRKGYLMKGDKVRVALQTKNFVRVYFTNKNEQITNGFILKKDIRIW